MFKKTAIVLLLMATTYTMTAQETTHHIEFMHFSNLITSADTGKHKKAIAYLDAHWTPEFNSIAIELAYLSRQNSVTNGLLNILSKHSLKNFGYNYNQWYEWLWNKDEKLAPYYHKLKGLMHRNIDPHFLPYFLDRQETATIRLDEVRWGGVKQDGIPPLRNPKMINATDAVYLEDDHIVFGIAVNGDFRAYPKRILAWHEMFTDTVGKVPVAGVYCTLCGTVILYKTELNGVAYNLGTSGFLYRSNKLMYDESTQSLWNTIGGTPAVGPLVGKGIELEYLSTVTTTWGEWRRLHPETTVLDINTGFARDYNEGVAYQSYFSTDQLMFNVPELDTSLKNKQSILAIRIPEISEESIAISVDFLKENPVFNHKIGTERFVVLTDKTGANRVFKTKDIIFKKYNAERKIAIDENDEKWQVYEDRLENETEKLDRLHSYNAFWFGWKAAFPETQLIK